MVNEAYLNRLNVGFYPLELADGEACEVDRLHPLRFRVDHQRSDRERDTIGNAAFLRVQLEEPGLAGEGVWKRPLAELQQKQRQRPAEQRGIQQIVHELGKAEPERSRR